jgi:hypothetical protein
MSFYISCNHKYPKSENFQHDTWYYSGGINSIYFLPKGCENANNTLILQREKLKLCTTQFDKFVNIVNENTLTCVFR